MPTKQNPQFQQRETPIFRPLQPANGTSLTSSGRRPSTGGGGGGSGLQVGNGGLGSPTTQPNGPGLHYNYNVTFPGQGPPGQSSPTIHQHPAQPWFQPQVPAPPAQQWGPTPAPAPSTSTSTSSSSYSSIPPRRTPVIAQPQPQAVYALHQQVSVHTQYHQQQLQPSSSQPQLPPPRPPNVNANVSANALASSQNSSPMQGYLPLSHAAAAQRARAMTHAHSAAAVGSGSGSQQLPTQHQRYDTSQSQSHSHSIPSPAPSSSSSGQHLAGVSVSNPSAGFDARVQQQAQAQYAHPPQMNQEEFAVFLRRQQEMQERGQIPPPPAPYPASSFASAPTATHQAAPSAPAPPSAAGHQPTNQPRAPTQHQQQGYDSRSAQIQMGARTTTGGGGGVGGAPPSPASSAGVQSVFTRGPQQQQRQSYQPPLSTASQPSVTQATQQLQQQQRPQVQPYPPSSQPNTTSSRSTTAPQSQSQSSPSQNSAPQPQPQSHSPSTRPITATQFDLRSPVRSPRSHPPPSNPNSAIPEDQSRRDNQSLSQSTSYPTPNSASAQLSSAPRSGLGSSEQTRNVDPQSKDSTAQEQAAQLPSSSQAFGLSRTTTTTTSSSSSTIPTNPMLCGLAASSLSTPLPLPIPDPPLPSPSQTEAEAESSNVLQRFRALIEPMDNMHLNIWHSLIQKMEGTIMEVHCDGERKVKMERARWEGEVMKGNERFKMEKARWEAEVKKANETAERERAAREEMKKKLDVVQGKVVHVVKTLQDRFLKVQSECDRIAKERDTALSEVGPLKSALEKMKEEMGELRKEKSAWEEERKFLSHLRRVNAFLEKELDMVKSANKETEAEVGRDDSDVVGVGKMRVGELESQREVLVKELEGERERREEVERRVRELEAEKEKGKWVNAADLDAEREKRVKAEQRVKELEAEREKGGDAERIVMELKEIIVHSYTILCLYAAEPISDTANANTTNHPTAFPSSTPLPPQPEVHRPYISGPPPRPVRSIIPESSPSIAQRVRVVVDDEPDARGQLSLRTPPPERVVVRRDAEEAERMVEVDERGQIPSSARLSRPIEPHPMDGSSPLYNLPTPSMCFSSALALSASAEVEEDVIDISSSRSASPELQQLPLSSPEKTPPRTPSIHSSSLPSTGQSTPAVSSRSRVSTPRPSSPSRTQLPTPAESHSSVTQTATPARPQASTPTPSSSSRTRLSAASSSRSRPSTPTPSSSSRPQPPTPAESPSAIPAKLKRKRDNEESPRKEVTPTASPAVHKRQRDGGEECLPKEVPPAPVPNPSTLKRKRDDEEETPRKQATANPVPVKGGIRGGKRKKQVTMFIPKKPAAWKDGPPPKKPQPQSKPVEVAEVTVDEDREIDVPMLPPTDDSSDDGVIDEKPDVTVKSPIHETAGTAQLFTPEGSVEDGEIVEEDVKNVKLEPVEDEENISDLVNFNAGIERMDLLYKINLRTGGISCRVCCYTPGSAITHFEPGVTWKQANEHYVKQHPACCRDLKMMDRQKVVDMKIRLGVMGSDGHMLEKSVVEILKL